MRPLPFLIAVFSTTAIAEVPNYDTESGIVSFPTVTVNHQDTYTSVQLYLNPNGTWQILSAERSNSSLDLSGDWQGHATSEAYRGCTASITATLSWEGSQLNGYGSLDGNCLEGGSGQITGSIEGNDINFGVALGSGTRIVFSGTLSDDLQTLTGTYNWPDEDDSGTWSLSLR